MLCSTYAILKTFKTGTKNLNSSGCFILSKVVPIYGGSGYS